MANGRHSNGEGGANESCEEFEVGMKKLPPQLPLRFFRWFCHPKLRDQQD
jgi:hypothetical protein